MTFAIRLLMCMTVSLGRKRMSIELPSSLFRLTNIKLPRELVSEPFGCLSNSLRPEITKQRARFTFSIDSQSRTVHCTVGNVSLTISYVDVYHSSSTNVSVLSVYDTYGLDVVLSYIEHLYSYGIESISAIEIYLAGSLLAIRPELYNELNKLLTIRTCSDLRMLLTDWIVCELGKLESQQPRLLAGLSSCPIGFTDDLLALMIPSNRVARSISTKRQRCSREVEMTETRSIQMIVEDWPY